MGSINFTLPLPIAAVLMFIASSIYAIYNFKTVIARIKAKSGTSINQAYKNCIFLETVGYLPSYSPLDPEREMEKLAKNLVVNLYSRKNAKLIYARILDCLEKHRFMLNSMSISDEIRKDPHFNRNFLTNVKMYFFLIDILHLKNKERSAAFEHFSRDNNYLYDDRDGYFKNFTTINFKPET